MPKFKDVKHKIAHCPLADFQQSKKGVLNLTASSRVVDKPLMRDVMARFVPNALKEILEAEQKKATAATKETPSIPEQWKNVA